MTISPQYIWNQVLDRLKMRLNPTAFETWLASATVQTFQDNCLVIQVENPFILNHLQKTYYSLIVEEVETIVGYSISVKLTTSQEQNWKIVDKDEYNYSSNKLNNKTDKQSPKLSQLNPHYNFSRFVVGPTNRMAHAASLAVAESPGREFNPLFLCGGVGLGKTHLMQAIAHYRLELYPNANVFYVSTEQFTNDLITSIRQDSMEHFREHYRTADILLVDDIQFIEGKEYTQEEFFHTFNTLHEAGKQVVIASDRPPKRIPSLQDRLVSRFSMGLIADIQVPDLETRMAILQKKAEYENIVLPRDVIEYIATNYTSNIRELEGALIRAVTYISISGLSMTVENIAPVLNPPMEQISVSPDVIIKIIAENFNVSIEDLKGSSRRREISLARQIGMYLMRQHTDLSLPRIGEEFGGKDHTTVLYSCDKISKLQKKDWDLSQQLSELSDRINIASRNQEK
ncbi:chromosomal replication initiator protein DnaA [Crocosphaera chwakensis]|uniref:Chromosomal replication initiator protein DnaA n=1 Tax=Crocosphaera chwakensis CCY0110 TaxID=391612 RepID=A3IW08_9CHRO|nr:chromosomal replication initiator protein DnaA [Crocosphaera chwakensis]EAZ89319.1 chromosomal replication initiation protein [Crocosphaera chwakensis CCY0110]